MLWSLRHGSSPALISSSLYSRACSYFNPLPNTWNAWSLLIWFKEHVNVILISTLFCLLMLGRLSSLSLSLCATPQQVSYNQLVSRRNLPGCHASHLSVLVLDLNHQCFQGPPCSPCRQIEHYPQSRAPARWKGRRKRRRLLHRHCQSVRR